MHIATHPKFSEPKEKVGLPNSITSADLVLTPSSPLPRAPPQCTALCCSPSDNGCAVLDWVPDLNPRRAISRLKKLCPSPPSKRQANASSHVALRNNEHHTHHSRRQGSGSPMCNGNEDQDISHRSSTSLSNFCIASRPAAPFIFSSATKLMYFKMPSRVLSGRLSSSSSSPAFDTTPVPTLATDAATDSAR